MEKRTLIFVILSLGIFFIYYQFFFQPPQAPEVNSAQSSKTTTTESAPSPAVSTPALNPTSNTSQNPVHLETLENANFRAEYSSKSGFPQHWWMRQYFEKPDKQGPNIDLLKGSEEVSPLSLVLFPGQAPLLPFFQGGLKGNDLVYQSDYKGLKITQTLIPSEKDYSLQVNLHLDNSGTEALQVAPGLRIAVPQTTESTRGFLIFKEATDYKFPLYRLGTSVSRFQNVKKLGISTEEVGDISWAGIEDRYFLRILLARQVSPQNRVVYGAQGDQVYSQLQYATEALPPGQGKDYQFTIYLGPKDPALLKSFGAARMDEAINYGWFSVIAIPILYFLKLFNSFLHNWGLAIIALTIFIKVLLYPLTRTSMKSMKAMQELQPQLQKLREKYADDREKLNVETMSLFKTHKVNPMGGCLPMLLQMPIYISLYKVLYNATELYHAPFFGVYHDLSAPDPYYILPILLGISMVLQQKMSPSAGDPAQAKMMMFMPILFSAFMLFLPLGLVLYIFVNTLMTVAQQWMNQKNISLLALIRGQKGGGTA